MFQKKRKEKKQREKKKTKREKRVVMSVWGSEGGRRISFGRCGFSTIAKKPFGEGSALWLLMQSLTLYKTPCIPCWPSHLASNKSSPMS